VSISVRETAVEIVGKHVVNNIQLLQSYKLLLLERIMDKGQSVRKKVFGIVHDVVVKIVKEWKLNHARKDEYRLLLIDVLASFINKMEDESKMKETLVDALKQVWFNKD